MDKSKPEWSKLLCGSSSKVETRTPITFVLLLSTFAAACGSIAYGFAVGYSSPAEAGIMDDLGLSLANYSAFSSFLTLGRAIGALISGRVAESVGRRVTMWLLELCFIIGWLSIIFAKNIWWLNAGRLLMGIGAGLHCYVAPIYVAEITPKNIRGGSTAAVTFTVSCAFSVMFFTGNFFTWRKLAVIGSIPCFIHVVCIFFIPESPRWLAKVGNGNLVEASLRCLRGDDYDVSQEADEIKDSTVRRREGVYVTSPLCQCRRKFDVCYGLYKARFSTCSQCSEQIHGTTRERTLAGCEENFPVP